MFEKGGGAFVGTKMLCCENPLPSLDETLDAAEGNSLGTTTIVSTTLVFGTSVHGRKI